MPAGEVVEAVVTYEPEHEVTPWVVKVRGVEVTRFGQPDGACRLVKDIRCSRVMAAHMPTVRPSPDVPVW